MKTIAELQKGCLEYLRNLNQSQLTLKNTGCQMQFFVRFLESEGITEPSGIQRSHILKWQGEITRFRTKDGLPLTPVSMNRKIVATKGFLNYLGKMGYIASSLAEEIRYVKQPFILPTSILTHEKFKRIASSIDTTTTQGYQARTIIELMYSSGLRGSELTGLKVMDIDFANGTALVHGKGDKDRTVPIGKTALKYLENFIRAVRPFMMRCRTDRLFLNKEGTPMRYTSLLQTVQKYCHDDEIHIATHTFRRSCATELLKADANMWHVKELLGHESLDTLKHYAKLTIVDLKKTHRKCHPREKSEGNEVTGG